MTGLETGFDGREVQGLFSVAHVLRAADHNVTKQNIAVLQNVPH